MRFHYLGLAHLPISRSYGSCAFTQKVVKLSKMLTQAGHEVFLYGCKSRVGATPVCTEFVETHTVSDIAADYGDTSPTVNSEIGYDWQQGEFRHDLNGGPKKPSTLRMEQACIQEIKRRARPSDFLLLSQGYYQKPIADALKLFLTCEPGIGYRGSYAPFRAFESAWLQHFMYGSEHPRQSINGNWYDRVIPNYFETDDVRFQEHKNGHALYLGRMILRKGIVIAEKACRAAGIKLLIAGQGGKVLADGSLTGPYNDFTIPKGNWEYLGYADWETRKTLLAEASMVFCPTLYLEPFCGVHVEAMLSGTPVITTDFGVFPETVVNGVNGYRCNMLRDFVRAAQDVRQLRPTVVRNSAYLFLTHNVVHQFTRWFDDLQALQESAADSTKKGWHRL